MVGVDEIKGFLVEFQALGRAAEDAPQFAVQFAQMGDVGAGGDFHAHGSADRGKSPVVRGLFHIRLRFNVFRSNKNRKKIEPIQGKRMIFTTILRKFLQLSEKSVSLRSNFVKWPMSSRSGRHGARPLTVGNFNKF
jgi:hypothetical protein